ncbi:germ cell-specific gene 1-like protein isoform X2 [Scyliorhinus canicula]|uniref:germ cell-specific gene 1-like protein isoform X2 n=1 Tax=Scyliorhinus canicula TaxID=7830 RepID=UPI0018F3284D|nr:germ cell-specific gene 1-like protein isoform X2 [Scyliorhinus canicula]
MNRDTIALLLNLFAVALSVTAVTSTYWYVGTQKVPKPTCTQIRTSDCIAPLTAETDTNSSTGNSEYNWEMGDDRFTFRSFHTGIWISCEENITGTGEKCRSFIDLTPITQQGLLGMVAHMMYTQVFQVTASQGPEDWRPHRWDFGWSFYLAWVSFTFCMASSVTALNIYTKTALEFHQSQKIYKHSLKWRPDELYYFPGHSSSAEIFSNLAPTLLMGRSAAGEADVPESLADEHC